jgi:hypothetical protein
MRGFDSDSLLLERESLCKLVSARILIFLLGLVGVGFRWHGERRLGFRRLLVRWQIRRFPCEQTKPVLEKSFID